MPPRDATREAPVISMTWSELLFAHWPLPAEALRSLVPGALELDLFDGRAWLGVVPFRMSDVRLLRAPAFGALESFLELNVRTYVRHRGRPGVWFFSLDTESVLTVAGARAWFHLPYFTARMAARRAGEWIEYESERTQPGAAKASFDARYRPTAPPATSSPGSLEHFLTERYALYALDSGGRVLRGEIEHEPWPLQAAEAEWRLETMARAAGVELPRTAPLVHYAERVDVLSWAPSVDD